MALTDDLFQSIDTIVQARIANLPYDQTIEGEILEVPSDNSNIYTVKYQAAVFEAYSTLPIQLSKGDIVYVQIPRNDFKENKLIISRKVSEKPEEVKTLPFLTFVKENNLFSEGQNLNEYIINANGGNTIGQTFNFSFGVDNLQAGYTRLGIKTTIKTNILSKMQSGDYGLKIDIYGFRQNLVTNATTQEINKLIDTYYFSKADMLGMNIYNTQGYLNQEKLINIKNFVISKITVSLWQDNNFLDINGNSITATPIFFTNLQMYFGYDKTYFDKLKANYEGDQFLLLYTTGGLQYDADTKDKLISLRLVQQNPNNKYNCYDPGYMLSRNYSYNLVIDGKEEDIEDNWCELQRLSIRIPVGNDKKESKIIANNRDNEISVHLKATGSIFYPEIISTPLTFINSLYANETGDDTQIDTASSKIVSYFATTDDGSVIFGKTGINNDDAAEGLKSMLSNISLTDNVWIKNNTTFTLIRVDDNNNISNSNTVLQSGFLVDSNGNISPVNQFHGTADKADLATSAIRYYDSGNDSIFTIKETFDKINESINKIIEQFDTIDDKDWKAERAITADKYNTSLTEEDGSIAKELKDIKYNISILQGYFSSGVASNASHASNADTSKYYDTSAEDSGNNKSIAKALSELRTNINNVDQRITQEINTVNKRITNLHK